MSETNANKTEKALSKQRRLIRKRIKKDTKIQYSQKEKEFIQKYLKMQWLTYLKKINSLPIPVSKVHL